MGYLSEYGKCKLSFFVRYISRCSQTLLEPRREKTTSVPIQTWLYSYVGHPISSDNGLYYIVILRCPVGSRMLHQNTTVIRRVTTVRTERGVRLTVCQGDVS